MSNVSMPQRNSSSLILGAHGCGDGRLRGRDFTDQGVVRWANLSVKSRTRSEKFLFVIAYLSLMLIVISQAWGAETGVLTLGEAVAEAERNNGTARAGRLEAQAALEREKQARAEFWPKLGLSTGSTHTDRPDVSLGLLADQNEPLAGFADRPDADNYRTEVGLDYVLYDGGRRSHRASAAGHVALARGHRSDADRARTLTRVVEAFYAALCANYQVEISEKEVTRMEERLALAEKLKAAGRATDADVSTAEYHLEDTKRLLLNARHSARDAREVLGILLGRSGPVRDRLDEEGANPLERAGALLSGSAEAAAAKLSPRLAALREEAAARDASARASRAAWIPTVSVSARYGYDSDDVFDSDRDSYVVGLVVSWNAFDGGAREARIRETGDLRRASAARLEEGEKEVRRAVRAAVRWCAEADATDRTAKKKVASYLARYQEKAKGHEAGRVSFDDLLEAQSELAQARLEGARAYCEARSARARLIEAAGSW